MLDTGCSKDLPSKQLGPYIKTRKVLGLRDKDPADVLVKLWGAGPAGGLAWH